MSADNAMCRGPKKQAQNAFSVVAVYPVMALLRYRLPYAAVRVLGTSGDRGVARLHVCLISLCTARQYHAHPARRYQALCSPLWPHAESQHRRSRKARTRTALNDGADGLGVVHTAAARGDVGKRDDVAGVGVAAPQQLLQVAHIQRAVLALPNHMHPCSVPLLHLYIQAVAVCPVRMRPTPRSRQTELRAVLRADVDRGTVRLMVPGLSSAAHSRKTAPGCGLRHCNPGRASR